MSTAVNSAASLGISIGTESALADIAKLRASLAGLSEELSVLVRAAGALKIGQALKQSVAGGSTAVEDEVKKAKQAVKTEMSSSAGEKAGADFGNGVRTGAQKALAGVVEDTAKTVAKMKASFSVPIQGGRITMSVPVVSGAAPGLAAQAAAFAANPGKAVADAAAAEAAKASLIEETRDRNAVLAMRRDLTAREQAEFDAEVALRRSQIAMITDVAARETAARKLDLAEQTRDRNAMLAMRRDLAARERAEFNAEVALRSSQIVMMSELAAREAAAAKLQETNALRNARFKEAPTSSKVRTLRVASNLEDLAGSDVANKAFTAEILAQRASLPALEAELVRVGQGHAATAAQTAAHTEAMKSSRIAMNDLHSSARGLGQSLGALWATYGSVVPLVAAAALGGALVNVFTAGKDVEYQLKFISGMSQEVAKLNDLLAITAGSQFTPKEAVEGLRALTQAGLSVHESLMVLPGVMNLAQLGEMSMGAAALTVTGALHSFNLGIDEAGRVGDVFAKAAAVSNTSVAGIAEAMKKASTVADFYHISLEQTAASLAVMAKRNIDGTAGGTALTNAMKELITPTNKARDAMKQLNVDAFDGTKLKDYDKLLDEFQKKTAGLNEKSRLTFLNDVFGERGAKAMNAILSDYDLYKKTLDDVTSSTGFLTVAQAELADTAEGAYKRASSALQSSFVKAFEDASPAVKNFFDQLAKGFSSEGFQSGLQTLITGIANTTSFITEHSDAITTMVEVYVIARLALAAMTIATTTLTTALTASRAATVSETVAVASKTEAITGSTVATLANAEANAANGASLAKAAAGTTALVGAMSGILRVAGLVGVAVSLLIPLYELLAARNRDGAGAQDAHSTAMDHAIKVLDDETAAIRRQIQATQELRGLAPAARKTDLNNSKVESDTDIAVMRGRLAVVNAELAKKPATGESEGGIDPIAMASYNKLVTEQLNLKKQITAETEKQGITQGKINTLEQETIDAKDKLARRRLEDMGKSIVGDPESGITGAAKNKKLDPALLKNVQDLIEQSRSGKGDVVAMTAAMSKMNDTVLAAGGTYTSKTSKGPKDTEQNDDYKNELTKYKEQFDLEKKTAEIEKAGDLARAHDLRAANEITYADETDLIKKAWNTYNDAVAAASAKELASMGNVARSDKRYKEEFDQELQAIRAKNIMDLALKQRAEDQKTADIVERLAIKKSQASFEGDQDKLRAKSVRELDDADSKYAQRFMSAKDAASAAAGVKMYDEQSKAVDGYVAALNHLERMRAQDSSSVDDKQFQEAMREVEASKAQRAELVELAKARTADLEAKKLSYSSGVEEAFNKYSKAAQDHAAIAEQAISGSFDKMSSALDTFVTTGKLDFKGLVLSMIQDLVKLEAKAAASKVFSQLGGMAVTAITGMSSTGVNVAQADMLANTASTLSAQGSTPYTHGGGIAGGTPTFSRAGISMSAFSGAPRFHSGGMIGANEVPIIAQKGEGVFTPEQMANLAPVGGAGGTSVVVNVNIASDGGATSDTKAKGDKSGKDLAQMVEAVVQTWVTKEKRPGGQLAG